MCGHSHLAIISGIQDETREKLRKPAIEAFEVEKVDDD